jgi:CRP/FNR family transcriptional regulator, cyclic AMP receptor protein
MNARATLLGRIPLFQGLAEDDLLALNERLSERKVRAGELVIAKGAPGSSLFVVISGSVRVFLPAEKPGGSPTILEQLGPGEFFGELALLDEAPRMASIEATADTLLSELSRESFVAQLQGSASAATAMLKVMAQRLRATTRLLETPAARNINQEADEKLTWGQRLADRVAQWNGSWVFIAIVFGLTLVWFAVNALASLSFDPYPYQFFNLFLAIVVALQGPLIMMSQNRQAAKERLHSEADYRVNLKNEVGIEQVLRELAELRSQVNSIGEAAPRS